MEIGLGICVHQRQHMLLVMDSRVGTLQRIIAAMGGKLKLVAQFPDEEIVINQFQ